MAAVRGILTDKSLSACLSDLYDALDTDSYCTELNTDPPAVARRLREVAETLEMNELQVLEAVIRSEAQYQHWRLDKTGTDAFLQVLKWIRKVRCREAIDVDGKNLVAESVREVAEGMT